MPSEWKYVSMEDIATKIAMGPFGSDIKTDNFVPSGVPIIRGGNLTSGRFHGDSFVYLTEEKADELLNSNVFPGDIVFTHRGTLGQVGLVPHSPFKRYVVSQSQMKLSCDRKLADPAFIYYFFKSPVGQHALLQNTKQTGVPAISRPVTSLKRIRLSLPPLAEQKAVAAVLGALDDKIELNRRMNSTVEAMARALFQSWFVDFDPVRAKLDGRKPAGLDEATVALFPAAFQKSPLGPIPLGWNVIDAGDISAKIAMGPFGSRITRDNFVPDGVPVVRGGNLTDGFVDDDFAFLTEAKADELKASVAHSLDLVFTHRGTLGQVGIVPYQSRYPRYVVSQSQMLLSVNRRKVSPWMVYLFFSSPIGEGALLANTSTTGVPAISRPTTSLKAIPIVAPPIAVSERFNEVVQPLFLQREQNARQCRTLATLRDTLLPKLLSGELSVRNLPILSSVAAMDVVESVSGE